MAFLTEPEPPRGVALPVLPGVRRVVARNPSVMTYHGTNTYLIDRPDGILVIDPGPNDARHVADVLAAAGAPITRILVTHTHSDHVGALAALAAATGARVSGYRVSGRADFTPDEPLDDGATTGGLTAIFTPGHAPDHLCYELVVPGTGKILFSGDHVMSWSSSIVSPPEGDMVAYYRSLERLLARDDLLYLGGHGPALADPRTQTRQLLAHRQHREATIMDAIKTRDWSIGELAEHLYHKTDYRLKIAAQRNVLAHMLKLLAEGQVAAIGETQPAAQPAWQMSDDLPPAEEASMRSQEADTMRRDAARRFAYAAGEISKPGQTAAR